MNIFSDTNSAAVGASSLEQSQSSTGIAIVYQETGVGSDLFCQVFTEILVEAWWHLSRTIFYVLYKKCINLRWDRDTLKGVTSQEQK